MEAGEEEEYDSHEAEMLMKRDILLLIVTDGR